MCIVNIPDDEAQVSQDWKTNKNKKMCENDVPFKSNLLQSEDELERLKAETVDIKGFRFAPSSEFDLILSKHVLSKKRFSTTERNRVFKFAFMGKFLQLYRFVPTTTSTTFRPTNPFV